MMLSRIKGAVLAAGRRAESTEWSQRDGFAALCCACFALTAWTCMSSQLNMNSDTRLLSIYHNYSSTYDFLFWFDAKSMLMSWWIEPLAATVGFSASIALFDALEAKEGAPPREGFSHFAMMLYWAAVWVWTLIVPLQEGIPLGIGGDEVSVALLAAEVIAGIIAYDALFFFAHWGMHSFTWTNRNVHAFHHAYSEKRLRARDVLTHSPLDGALQVLANIAAQRFVAISGPKSKLARCIHNLLVTFMLTESHTSAKSCRLFRRFCAGVQRHRSHHGGAAYYQQFFGYLDDARRGFVDRSRASRCKSK